MRELILHVGESAVLNCGTTVKCMEQSAADLPLARGPHAAALRDFLRSAGISQTAFGSSLTPPVSQGLVSQWLLGVTAVTLERAVEIVRLTSGAVKFEDLASMHVAGSREGTDAPGETVAPGDAGVARCDPAAGAAQPVPDLADAEVDWTAVMADMKAAGWTQIRVARAVGSSQSTIAQLATGTTTDPAHALGTRLLALHGGVVEGAGK